MFLFVTASGGFIISDVDAQPPGTTSAATDLDLETVKSSTHVWSGTALVPRSSIGTWFIDGLGQKHAQDAPDRQRLDCRWNEPIVLANGLWRVKTTPEVLSPIIKSECERRILVVASRNTQMNLTAAASVGAMDAPSVTTYASAVAWVADMRARCAELIAASDLQYTQDAKWPPLPAGVADLCAKY